MRDFLIALTRNVISLMGAGLTTASAVLILVLFGMGFVGFEGGPYSGILTYLVLPVFFVLGLVLIPLGVWRERRRTRRAMDRGEPPPAFPVIDLNREAVRRLVLLFIGATALNVAILALATYKGVDVMESTTFCGTTCHTVMIPEYTTYLRSPHSRVRCVECHIGPGADWFVKSKLSGAWQVVSVTFDLYSRPIPTPIHNLRPARETCEQCHWPEKFVGDRLKVRTHFADDEKNTEKKTVLLLKVGGTQGRLSQGIHWHVGPGIRIRYRGDESRENISEVELDGSDGTVKTYRTEHADKESGFRVMDCVDCHNRPTHIYRMAADEIDAALQEGRIDRTLPYIRREGLKALEQAYASHDQARRRIPDAIRAYYAEHYTEQASSRAEAIAAAGRTLADIYCTNVFPTMKIAWGSYPNHLGHQDFPGCFRCHDDSHKTAQGETISQDCSTCHTILAMEEENPEILSQLNGDSLP